MNVVIKYNLYEEECFYNNLCQQLITELCDRFGYTLNTPALICSYTWAEEILIEYLKHVLFNTSKQLFNNRLTTYHFNKMVEYKLLKKCKKSKVGSVNPYLFRGHVWWYTK